jgi:hypothetical protein
MEERSDVPATMTAPASGLFLESVIYTDDEKLGALRGVPGVPSSRP